MNKIRQKRNTAELTTVFLGLALYNYWVILYNIVAASALVK